MATPLAFRPFSKRIQIWRGDRIVGWIHYDFNEHGWIATLDGGLKSGYWPVWTDAAKEISALDA